VCWVRADLIEHVGSNSSHAVGHLSNRVESTCLGIAREHYHWSECSGLGIRWSIFLTDTDEENIAVHWFYTSHKNSQREAVAQGFIVYHVKHVC